MLGILLGWSSLAWSKEDVGTAFRKLFKVLESGDSISPILDRRQWPDHDLLASYLEVELLTHPRYRMTPELVRQFLKKWPAHPYATFVRQAMAWRVTRKSGDAEALAWYASYPPKSQSGKKRYVTLLLAERRITAAWPVWRALYREGVTLSQKSEEKSRAFYKKLTTLDHETRAKALLKQGSKEFDRVVSRLPPSRRAYFRVMAVASRGSEEFPTLVTTLPAETATDTALWDAWAYGLYRFKRDHRFVRFILGQESHKLSAKARRLLRFRMGRTLYHRKQLGTAIRVLKANVQEAGGTLSDSLWLAAWSAHLHGDHKQALAWFIQLAQESTVGQRRAQGAYWAAKVSRSTQQKQKWLARAARYPGTFYGLLAREEHRGKLRPLIETFYACPTSWTPELARRIQALTLLKKAGRSHYIGGEIGVLAKQYALSQEDQHCIAKTLGAADWAVQVGNDLVKQGKLFWSALYPLPDWTPLPGWTLDPAVIWATTRQESLFSHRAESSAQALGLMQLIPSTARAESKRAKLRPANRYWLKLPAYNLALGQSYLTRMLRRFDGDLVLALASYNAGPGRGDKWKKRRQGVDPLLFIEEIPFSETRNYVKRVIHGVAMYRLRLYGAASLNNLIQPGEKALPLAKHTPPTLAIEKSSADHSGVMLPRRKEPTTVPVRRW